MPRGDHPNLVRAIQRVAARQRMLVTTAQLEALGMGEHARRSAVAQGDLLRRRRGVYALAGAAGGWEEDVMAAVLAVGAGAVASFDTARRLWLLPDAAGPATARAAKVARPPNKTSTASTASTASIALTTPRLARLDGVTTHQACLPPSEVTSRQGIPVTTVSQTLLDLAGGIDTHGGQEVLGALVDDALRQRIVRLTELERIAAARPAGAARARRGSAQLLAATSLRRSLGGPGGSAWEEQMDRAWDRMGLPPAVRQYWIDTPQGRYCVDRAIVASKIAVEWNGYEYHGQRSRFDRDSDRRGHLAAVGWLVLDFTSRSSLEHIRRTVLAAVAQRPAAPPPAQRAPSAAR